MYPCDIWTFGTPERNKLEAFEICSYRRIWKTKYTDKVRNEKSLEHTG